MGVAIAAAFPVAGALAQSSGTNAHGPHNNRKTGDDHCHRGRGAPGPFSGRRKPQMLLSAGPVHFSNCTEARAAGAAPLRRGEPGYRPAMDRDNDGVACE